MPEGDAEEPCKENEDHANVEDSTSPTVETAAPAAAAAGSESQEVQNESSDALPMADDSCQQETPLDPVGDAEPNQTESTVAAVQSVSDANANIVNGGDSERKAVVTADPNSVALSKRKFRITGLHYPGEDITLPEIVESMLTAQSFHLWFEREPNKGQSRKKGGLSFVFDEESSAKQAYSRVKELIQNGAKWKVYAAKSFDESPIPTQQHQQETKIGDVPKEEDPERFQKLYVDQLVPSADQDLIYAIFGKDNLKDVEVRMDQRKSDGSKCAVLAFHDRESAEQAKLEYDEFTVDDGDVSRPMRILLYVDYLNKVEHDRLRKERTATVRTPAISFSAERPVENADVERRPSQCTKGKAGSLWSAQIAENRREPLAIMKPKGTKHPPTDHQHEKHHHPSRGPSHTAADPAPIPEPASSVLVANVGVVVAPSPPPPPPEEPIPVVHQPSPHNLHRPPSRAEGELKAGELAVLINACMERDRINWAELNTLEDLWALVHNASKDAAWQPEMTLKEAMAVALDQAYTAADAEWQRDHLACLIKLWKKELETDVRSQIRKQLQLSETDAVATASPNGATGVDYTPPPSEKPEKRRRNKATKKALMQMMGVGALLADVKKDAQVEEEEREKAAGVSKKKKEEVEKRKRKHSASESGEASTTTEDEGEASNWEEGTASSSECRQGQQKGKQVASRLPPKPKMQQRKRQPGGETRSADAAVPSTEQFGNWMNTMMQTMSGGGAFQQQWMTQAMPMMLQMMPMMAQMMQAQRVLSAASANVNQGQQQQTQQFMQMMQQLMSTMGQSSAPAPPPPQQQALGPAVSAWPHAQPANRPIDSAPHPSGGQQAAYFSHYHQPPPPPATVGAYGPAGYARRGGAEHGQAAAGYPFRGNYTSR